MFITIEEACQLLTVTIVTVLTPSTRGTIALVRVIFLISCQGGQCFNCFFGFSQISCRQIIHSNIITTNHKSIGVDNIFFTWHFLLGVVRKTCFLTTPKTETVCTYVQLRSRMIMRTFRRTITRTFIPSLSTLLYIIEFCRIHVERSIIGSLILD